MSANKKKKNQCFAGLGVFAVTATTLMIIITTTITTNNNILFSGCPDLNQYLNKAPFHDVNITGIVSY